MASDKPVSHEEAERAMEDVNSRDWDVYAVAARTLKRYIREQREREATMQVLAQMVDRYSRNIERINAALGIETDAEDMGSDAVEHILREKGIET